MDGYNIQSKLIAQIKSVFFCAFIHSSIRDCCYKNFIKMAFAALIKLTFLSVDLPIIDWSSADVFAALNGNHNPLYDIGFDRVGCFPCLAAGDATKERAFAAGEFGRQQREKVRTIEFATGKNVFTSAGGCQRNNPNQIDIFDGCAICAI